MMVYTVIGGWYAADTRVVYLRNVENERAECVAGRASVGSGGDDAAPKGADGMHHDQPQRTGQLCSRECRFPTSFWLRFMVPETLLPSVATSVTTPVLGEPF